MTRIGSRTALPETIDRRALSPHWRTGPQGRRWSAVVFLVVAFGMGGLSTVNMPVTVGICAGCALAGWVWARPAVAAYLLIVVTPLTAGIDRGLVVPALRPNEAAAVTLSGVLAARGLARLRTRGLRTVRIDRVELSVILLAVTSSVVPLLWMLVRQREVTHDDLLYSLVMWKYLALYVVVRLCVTSADQVQRCLWLCVTVGCVVALIAVFQSLELFGVPRLLATYYAPFGYTDALRIERGSSTLGLPAATADLLIYDVAITAGLFMRGRRHRIPLAGAGVVLVFGVLSSGQFSSAIGLLVGVVCIAVVTGVPGVPLYLLLTAGVGAKALEPVVRRRLSGFQSASGLPESWTGRLHNLRTYFWPKLLSDGNVLFGVRPSARVPVATQATGYVWIESGYTWLLWGGGIPLLASFLLFVYAAARRGWRGARQGRDAVSVAGLALFVAVIVTAVLMAFDPHLTYRGSADALFVLLALAAPRESDGQIVPSPAAVRPDLGDGGER